MRVTVLSFLEEYIEVIESCRDVIEAGVAAAGGEGQWSVLMWYLWWWSRWEVRS